MKPLTLEDGKAGTFLETSFRITNNKIEHWLKNDNDCERQKFGGIIISIAMGRSYKSELFYSNGMFTQGTEDGEYARASYK